MTTKKKNTTGLTLVELLVAMVVAGIVLAAVASLAYAMTAANTSTGDTAQKQARLRYTALRITGLIKHCKLVCGTPQGDLALWKSDHNGDNQINVNELIIIQKGDNDEYLKLCEFPSDDNTTLSLDQIQTINPSDYSCSYVTLLPQCSNVSFSLDLQPPYTGFVSISLDLVENEITRHYQMNAKCRCNADYLINRYGQLASEDDD